MYSIVTCLCHTLTALLSVYMCILDMSAVVCCVVWPDCKLSHVSIEDLPACVT